MGAEIGRSIGGGRIVEWWRDGDGRMQRGGSEEGWMDGVRKDGWSEEGQME